MASAFCSLSRVTLLFVSAAGVSGLRNAVCSVSLTDFSGKVSLPMASPSLSMKGDESSLRS